MGNCQSYYNASIGRCCRCARIQPRPPAQPVPVVPAAPETPEAPDAGSPPSDPVESGDVPEELPQPEMWRMPLPRPPSVASGKFISFIKYKN